MSDRKAERQQKVDRIIENLASSAEGREILKESLHRAGIAMMNVISRETFPVVTDPDRLARARRGIILDTETTGVDVTSDEIIELGMVEFTYDQDGILSIGKSFEALNEPLRKRIDAEVEGITGISNDMVAGHRIDPGEVSEFIGDASLIIAHHSNFDRKIVELNLPEVGFDTRPWGCSLDGVDWKARGKNSRSLEALALSEGYVFGSHRADADCMATLFVLNSMDSNGKTAFAEMRDSAATKSLFIIAEKSPFSRKDEIKNRDGYKWSSDGTEAYGHKAWHVEIPDTPEAVAEEAAFLRDIYGKDVSLPCYHVDYLTRHSARKPSQKELFRTREVAEIAAAADQYETDRRAQHTFEL